MKQWLAILLALLLSGSPLSASTLELEIIDSDGSLRSTLPGFKQGQLILADLDDFFSSLKFNVEWNSSLERLLASKKSQTFKFRSGSQFIQTPDKRVDIVKPPVKRSGNLYFNIDSLVKIVSNNTNKSVIWNKARRQVQLRNPNNWSDDSDKNLSEDDPIGEFIDQNEKSGKKNLVVIDPGHGGRDPGAIGSNNLYEKKVVLEMALQVKKTINNKYSNLTVRLTRDNDKFLPLQKRTQLANEWNADIFVSIHANSGRSSVAKGFEIFTLSGEASDPSAKELAKIENSALRYEGHDAEKLEDVRWILWQLRSTIHSRESREVADELVDEMENKLPLDNRGMKQAPFWVLKDARMPAVLVESGFLSNPEEAAKLADDAYQKKFAHSIAEGLSQYIKTRQE